MAVPFKKVGLGVFGALTILGALVTARITATNAVVSDTSTSTHVVAGTLVATSTANLQGAVTLGSTLAVTNGTATFSAVAVTGTESVTGLLTANGGITNNGASIVNGNFTVSSTLFFVNSTTKQVSVGTTTALGADFTVHNNAGTASSTLMLGTSADGSKRGTQCFWNGTNYTLLQFYAGTGMVTSTSATCP